MDNINVRTNGSDFMHDKRGSLTFCLVNSGGHS